VTIPAEFVRWGEWQRRFPKGQILVGDERTGRFFRVSEGKSRHEGASPTSPEAPMSRMDPRLPPMERVVGVRNGGLAAYPSGLVVSHLSNW